MDRHERLNRRLAAHAMLHTAVLFLGGILVAVEGAVLKSVPIALGGFALIVFALWSTRRAYRFWRNP